MINSLGRLRFRRLRLGGPDAERGSMAILLMVVLVGMVLSAMIVPVIITQDRTTKFDSTRVLALNAAESGIDMTLGVIRASITSAADPIGDSKKLPCGPTSGAVNATSVASYSLVIEYFTADPVAEPYPSPKALQCASPYGPYQSASPGVGGGPITPKFARLTSTGTVGTAVNGSTAGRTLTSTYGLKTSDLNFSGGVIKIDPLSAALCMDVGTAPVANTPLMLQNCSTSNPPAPQQVFAYRTDLTLQLSSTAPSNSLNGCDRTTPTNCGLCLNTAATPAVAGNAMQLSPCGPLNSPASYTQQWSYNDDARFQASNSTSAANGTLADLCMTPPGPSAGVALTVETCGTSKRWVPASSIGAGAAALPQWVNYSEFGRCLDVTGGDILATHLIDYPCKQNPFPGAVTWNQRFQAPAIPAGQTYVTGQISTTVSSGGTNYCLTSPSTNGGYVTMQQCAGSALQTWTIYNGDKSLPYSSKYRIKGGVGGALCLGLAPAYSSEGWSSVVVEECSGATDQKWNGAASVLSPGLKDTKER